ncbi:MAG: DEAD/DEAH box helicase, partial [Candidatus Thalassarchaeaceae archaeon]|nr:DEAD/DEAH box helicase [Candidatus Thalassarchaeaceae archaeon]
MESRIAGYLAHDELRPGQAEMIDEAYKVLTQRGCHLACAPTGIGKTAAALSSALDAAFESDEPRTIFFLTGRQSQHRIVVETVRNINQRSKEGQNNVRLIDMVGQQSMCIDEIRHEFSSLFSRLCADKRKNRH